MAMYQVELRVWLRIRAADPEDAGHTGGVIADSIEREHSQVLSTEVRVVEVEDNPDADLPDPLPGVAGFRDTYCCLGGEP